jgi:isopenicillin-N N-acyltransferase-like protein
MLDLPQIHIAGTPAEMGRQQGEALRERIHAFVDQRRSAARGYLAERGHRDAEALVGIGRRCLGLLKAWDAPGWLEHCATAEAAGIDAAELYTYGNYTDVRDVLALPAMTADAEGCSATLLPPSRTACRQVIAAQTWDLNPTDIDYVVAVHRAPANGHRTWSVTCAGCPSLIGMNDAGLAVGTTNIKTRGSRPGIPYLSLLHRMIRCTTLGEAATVLEKAHRAAAHTYWVADRQGAALWECTATTAVRQDLHDVPVVQTNHCQIADHQRSEGEPATPSSRKRLARLGQLMSQGSQDVESIKRAFADRSDGVDSINRFGEDQQGTATNACIVAIPARRELHACRGSADRGQWLRLGFT